MAIQLLLLGLNEYCVRNYKPGGRILKADNKRGENKFFPGCLKLAYTRPLFIFLLLNPLPYFLSIKDGDSWRQSSWLWKVRFSFRPPPKGDCTDVEEVRCFYSTGVAGQGISCHMKSPAILCNVMKWTIAGYFLGGFFSRSLRKLFRVMHKSLSFPCSFQPVI